MTDKKRTLCATPSCAEEAYCRGYCKGCYAGMRYWVKKGLGSILERQQKLVVLGERLDAVSTANVVHIRARRRA